MRGAGQEIIDGHVAEGRVRLVYWPMLDLGPNSENAAVSAFCAGEQSAEAFWHMHDALFKNQGRVYVASRDDFVSKAATLGLDAAAFETCYDSEAMRVAVRRLDDARRDAGIRQRPTFDVGGQLVLGSQPFAVYDEIIRAKVP